MTKLQFYRIINTAHEKSEEQMRVCWNRQTGTFEGRVFHDVRVQVPSLAPLKGIDIKYQSSFNLYQQAMTGLEGDR